jgi:rhodanese-related sulfurtransferase
MTTTITSPALSDVLSQAREYGAEHGLPYAGTVSPTQAWQLASSGAATIVDVRSRFEHEFVGHVPGSQLLEWRIYAGNAEGGVTSRPNPDFLHQLQQLHQPDAPLLLLCRSAVRSHNAAIAAAEAGYTNVYNILEGFEGDKDESGRRGTLGGWRKAGLPWNQG